MDGWMDCMYCIVCMHVCSQIIMLHLMFGPQYKVNNVINNSYVLLNFAFYRYLPSRYRPDLASVWRSQPFSSRYAPNTFISILFKIQFII